MPPQTTVWGLALGSLGVGFASYQIPNIFRVNYGLWIVDHCHFCRDCQAATGGEPSSEIRVFARTARPPQAANPPQKYFRQFRYHLYVFLFVFIHLWELSKKVRIEKLCRLAVLTRRDL